MTIATSKPSLLFLFHYGGLTGAPIVSFELIKYLESLESFELAASFNDLSGPLIELLGSGITLAPWQALLMEDKDKRRSLLARVKRKLLALAHRRFETPMNRFSDYDLVYANTIICGPKALEIKKRYSTPYILHCHEMLYWLRKANLPNISEILVEAEVIIAPSRSAASDIAKLSGIESLPIEVVGEISSNSIAARFSDHGCDRDILATIQVGHTEATRVCLGVGSETWRKGKDLFIATAGWAQRIRPAYDWRFVWIGGIPSDEEQIQLDIEMQRYGCNGCISWFSQAFDIQSIMSVSDFFLLTSRDDPQPLVALEAFDNDLPLLCFDSCGGIPELLVASSEQVIPYADCQLMAQRLIQFADKGGRVGLQDMIANQRRIAKSLSPEVILPVLASKIINSLHLRECAD
jgi:glycosyltransferase involved in cell wall biosynthesis